ncbi:MAG: hypothetical protein ACYC5O_06165 [Anaerolineae bacterium]
MQRKVLYAAVALALLAALIAPVLPVAAQSATNQTWTSSITYYTPDASGGDLWVDYYYEEGALAQSYGPLAMAGHKAGSLFIGEAGVPGDFTGGSAVMRATVPVIATYVQYAVSPETSNYGRLMYTGFSSTDAASTFYVPTFLYQNAGFTSLMSVQNVEATSNMVHVRVYAPGSATAAGTKDVNLDPYSATILSPADLGLTTGFTGSVVITADGGSVVASAQETQDAGRGAYSFEGAASGASTIYMASMLCQYNSNNTISTSYFAIQNTSTSATANVSVQYYNTAGTPLLATPYTTDITAGNKKSVDPCATGAPANSIGSAVITSTGASVIAMGKIVSSTGLRTAFVGASAGATKIAAPYIRWAANPAAGFRSYIAVMNVGSGPASNVVATYYDATGAPVGSDIIASGSDPLNRFIKRNTNPGSGEDSALDGNGNFGMNPFGGAVEITSDQPIVVVIRVQQNVSLGATTVLGEDYNGLAVP